MKRIKLIFKIIGKVLFGIVLLAIIFVIGMTIVHTILTSK